MAVRVDRVTEDTNAGDDDTLDEGEDEDVEDKHEETEENDKDEHDDDDDEDELCCDRVREDRAASTADDIVFETGFDDPPREASRPA